MPRQGEEALEYDDFLGWTISSLKDFLSLRRRKQTGRNSEFVARAFGAYELNPGSSFRKNRFISRLKSNIDGGWFRME